MVKRIFSAMLVLMLLGSLAISASALHPVVDMTKKGSIQVTMKNPDKDGKPGKPIPGGTLTLIRVADVGYDNGDFFFTYTADFADCSVPVTELASAALPEALEKIVKAKKLTGPTQTLDKNGQTTFADLELGLYLLVQNKNAPGYGKAKSFLVSVPGFNAKNNVYVYNVDATPKMSPPAPVPTTTNPPRLPQTGQNNWPVPVLAVVGLMVFCGGWLLFVSGRKRRHEN